ncbi:MAG TPA: hypothetical protein DFK19_02445 [Ochrobactrum sp.]|nr:hypothetical protein [Ochrobactrum sp.]
MNGPKHESKYADRAIDCQDAVAAGIINLLDEAEKAGWDRVEAAKAIVNVAIGIHMGETGKDPEE